jgi:hypothetical protein
VDAEGLRDLGGGLAFLGEAHDKGSLFCREFTGPPEFHAALFGGLATEAGTFADRKRYEYTGTA